MIKFEFNGKPFNPKTFEEQFLRAAMEQAANEMHERVSAIRHPDTGEFPTVVVSGTSVEDMSMRIEGSPELLRIVSERLGVTTVGERDDVTPGPATTPKVFLSWGWEDRALAEPIATALMSKGVDTWWSEWCINAGDSLRQKIDEGLSDCTHFIVLLTPQSIGNPEQDAIKLALDLVQDTTFPSQAAEIAARYGWQPRRLNPALAYLINRKVILDYKTLGTMPWLTHWVQKTEETRRFARSRAT